MCGLCVTFPCLLWVCVCVTQMDCSLSGSRLSGSDAKAASLSTTMWSSAACSDWSIQSRLPGIWQAFRVTSTKWLTDNSNAVALKWYTETLWEQEAWRPSMQALGIFSWMLNFVLVHFLPLLKVPHLLLPKTIFKPGNPKGKYYIKPGMQWENKKYSTFLYLPFKMCLSSAFYINKPKTFTIYLDRKYNIQTGKCFQDAYTLTNT